MSPVDTAFDYEMLSAEELIERIVLESQGNKICVTSSFQVEDMVVLHMLKKHVPDLPVIFLETGYHFKEVIDYRDRIASEWKLNLINALPELTVERYEAQFGKLHIVQPTECCKARKVEPLMRSLEPFDWWFTGLRREQSPTRANLKKVQDHRTPSGKHLKKLSVLADWDWDQVNQYARVHEIPQLGLYARGYTSIGCEPCTAIPEAGADPRSGRWGGKKLECGIHTFSERS
jgi:phosphoadenosine phosphosulfate reductase